MATATSCRRWHDAARTLPGNQFRRTPPRRAGSLCWSGDAETRMPRRGRPGNHPGNQAPTAAAVAYAGGAVMVGDPLSPTLRRGPGVGVFSERIQRCRILYGDVCECHLCSPTPFVRGSRSYQSATGTHRSLIFCGDPRMPAKNRGPTNDPTGTQG
jgi:hypothetical protein